jgi:hypothetical protein
LSGKTLPAELEPSAGRALIRLQQSTTIRADEALEVRFT